MSEDKITQIEIELSGIKVDVHALKSDINELRQHDARLERKLDEIISWVRTVGDKIVSHCSEMLDLMALANATKRAERAQHIQDILKHVHDKGQGTGPREEVGTVLYVRGLMAASVA